MEILLLVCPWEVKARKQPSANSNQQAKNERPLQSQLILTQCSPTLRQSAHLCRHCEGAVSVQCMKHSRSLSVLLKPGCYSTRDRAGGQL